MPGLEPSNYSTWDDNVYSQYDKVDQNIGWMLDVKNENFQNMPHNIRVGFRDRYIMCGKVGGGDPTMPIDISRAIHLQKDIGAYIYLRDINYDFSNYNGDTTDLYDIAWNNPKEKGFPKILVDAATSIRTDGKNPPAKEMQTAQDYFATRAAESVTANEA